MSFFNCRKDQSYRLSLLLICFCYLFFAFLIFFFVGEGGFDRKIPVMSPELRFPFG